MKDIFEILKGCDIEVPEDKVAEIKKAVYENYKTVNEFNNKVNKLDEQLTTANTTINYLNTKIKDLENVDVHNIKTALAKRQELVSFVLNFIFYQPRKTTPRYRDPNVNLLQVLRR